MKAVIYARFSSDNQREESITAQVRACTEYARRNGYTIVKVYTDEARSATTDDRPGFLEMIEGIKTGRVKVNVVLVHKLDRFARSRYDSAVYRKILAGRDVRLIAADQPLDDSPESVLLESLLEGLAEYYSKNLAREVMKGMKENAYQARFNGGWTPLGYDVVDGHYVINEQEASVVRLIFFMFLEGYRYKPIQDALKKKGFMTKRGRPFGKNSIYEILRNPKYAGYYVFNRAPRRVNGKRNWHRKKNEEEIIMVPGAIPAIISEEDFNQVQEKMNKRQKGPRQRDDTLYILTGKVKCGACGAAMVGNSSRRKAGAEPTRYYECNQKLRTRECKSRRIPKEVLENHVLDEIEIKFLSPADLPKLARTIMQLVNKKEQVVVDEAKQIKKELQEVERKIANIIKAIEDGTIEYELLGGRLKTLKARREELECRLDTLRSPMEGLTEEMVMQFLFATKNTLVNRENLVECKKIMDLYVHSIKVFNDDLIDIMFKIPLGADKDGVGGGT